MNVRTDSLKTLGWGALWLSGGVYLWLSMAQNPFQDLRLMLWAKTADGQIVDTSEDAGDGDDGRVHWSSAVMYTFTLPDGREVEGVSKSSSRLPPEWANLENPLPVVVEYLPSSPSLSRLQGDGSHSFVHWLWRTALSLALLMLFISPGVMLTRDGLNELRQPSPNSPELWP
jgi:hypothetical protein